MIAVRHLIVNADDFGQSAGVNRGIAEAHEQGIVTSASMMVRWPAAAEAAAYGRQRPELSLGLHFDLGEWAYRNETWVPLYQVVALDETAAITDEIARQVATFRSLVGKDPSHIDSHQHVHLREPVRSVVVETARRLGVPLRGCSSEIRYCGDFYGQTAEGSPLPEAISISGLIKVILELPPGITELGCHPGHGNDLVTMYGAERAKEVEVLCDPLVLTAISDRDIHLCSFTNFAGRALQSQPGSRT
jgi:predicted glycoside hydrolase/deacetylase ChbG (UPF0249 family)